MMLLKILGIVCAVAVAAALLVVGWALWFADPPVEVMTVGPAVRFDTRFLGEFYFAATLIEVTGSDGQPVLRATSSLSHCNSDLFVFHAGVNPVPALASGNCAIVVPRNSSTFELKAGAAYTFTVVGKNGLGHDRTASRGFTVPGLAGAS